MLGPMVPGRPGPISPVHQQIEAARLAISKQLADAAAQRNAQYIAEAKARAEQQTREAEERRKKEQASREAEALAKARAEQARKEFEAKADAENKAANAARELSFKMNDEEQRAQIAKVIQTQQEKNNMPLPAIIPAVGAVIGVAKKVGPVLKDIGKGIGNLFKSKKKKKAEAEAKAKAAQATFKLPTLPPIVTPTKTSLDNLGIGATYQEKKSVPAWAWVAGGVFAFGSLLVLAFKRK